MASGGRQYFINTYINIRVIRETHGCRVPIEWFYPGPQSISPQVVSYMERTFANLRMIDVYAVEDMQINDVPNVSPKLRKGYPLKAFAVLLSSFKEVLFIDADSFPVENPEVAFHFPQYVSSGALFWPDLCNYYTIRPKAYDVLGMQRPPHMLILGDSEPFRWPHEHCGENEPREFETGQFVVNKERVWMGLLMTVFINWHSGFFMNELIHGDKSTLKLGFESTGTPYALVGKTIYLQGIAAPQDPTNAQSPLFFCGSGISQPHPITGKPLFIHRGIVKFSKWPAQDYLAFDPIPRAWTHIAQQHPKKAWGMVLRFIDGRVSEQNRPSQVWLPRPSSQHGCLYPLVSTDAKIETAPKNVRYWSYYDDCNT